MALTRIKGTGITNLAVDTAQLAADAVTGAKIEDNAVDTEHLADDAIEAAELASDAVVNASVASDAAIATSKISGALTSVTSSGLGTAAARAAEDTMTNGSNLPDGAAIKTYGDANWSGGGGGLTGQFMVHLTANQSLSSGVWTVVGWDDTVGLDENNYFSGNNYTPTVAGYYFLFFRGKLYGLDDGERFQMHIENSYDDHQRIADEVGVYEDNNTVFCSGSVIVYADGANDTFRVRAIQTDAGSLNLSGGNWNNNYPNSWTYFGGWRIK